MLLEIDPLDAKAQVKADFQDYIYQKLKIASGNDPEALPLDSIVEEIISQSYPGIQKNEIDTALILAIRSKIEQNPQYTYVAARLLLEDIYLETLGSHREEIVHAHKTHFKTYLEKGIHHKRLTPDLLNFDLDYLAHQLDPARDHLFKYQGLQTLYDRYFIHIDNRRIEPPQYFWMRIAMGLALGEAQERNTWAATFYHLISQFYFTPSTPTLFNAGTLHPQLSSCYLSTISDSLDHIFKVMSDNAKLSKWAGGIGNDWTNVRASGAMIEGTNGLTQGIIPFLKVANDIAVAVNQGGKRKGSFCAYLEVWHQDIEDFIELRKNTGDERRRTHDMNIAVWIPDLFMKRLKENENWTLFNPADVPDLHDLYGKEFEERYTFYEEQAKSGEIKQFKNLPTIDLWKKMLTMLFETGHPWITFKDPSNIRSMQSHRGVIHSSNLCTEILLNTSETETAVCNLGSINLPKHFHEGNIDKKQLASTIKTAIRMLDNVININFYPTPEAELSNKTHRPIGLGLMGFHEALLLLKMPFDSVKAVSFSDEIQELISYYSILASSELAAERGAYPSFKGSKWDAGWLPNDTIEILKEARGAFVDVDRSSQLNWQPVRESIQIHGMRHSNLMAIAPTATIAHIVGTTPSIEPIYSHLHVKSNLSGEFCVVNELLVHDLKRLNLWDSDLLEELKYYDGSIQAIDRIPQEMKDLYKTAFEIKPYWLIEHASRKQKWIDMGQSLNLYVSDTNGKLLSEMYQYAWEKGLKTTYYLRSRSATQVEKSTLDINKKGIQPRWMKHRSASSHIQVDRSSCSLNGEENCESCQ